MKGHKTKKIKEKKTIQYFHDNELYWEEIYQDNEFKEISKAISYLDDETIEYSMKNKKKHGRCVTTIEGEKNISFYYEDKELQPLRFSKLDKKICKLCMGEDFEGAFKSTCRYCKYKYKEDKIEDLEEEIDLIEEESELPDECPYKIEHYLENH